MNKIKYIQGNTNSNANYLDLCFSVSKSINLKTILNHVHDIDICLYVFVGVWMLVNSSDVVLYLSNHNVYLNIM